VKRKKNNEKYYQDLYRFDSIDQAYVIEVLLDTYDDVYDEWDPSPFKRRDIEDEFDDFVWDSSQDIPLKHKTKLVLYLPESEKNEQKERILREAYDNFYTFRLIRALKAIKTIQKKILLYLILSVMFLYIGYFYSAESGIFMSVLKEGIFIGGWVFLWEVFTLVFITLGESRRDIKHTKRILESKICFVYKSQEDNKVES
jgi:hypothetical protein